MIRLYMTDTMNVPREVVFDCWVAYGSERRSKAIPLFRSISVGEAQRNVLEWEVEHPLPFGRVRERRRVTMHPKHRVDEEVLTSTRLARASTIQATFESARDGGTRVGLDVQLGLRFPFGLVEALLQPQTRRALAGLLADLKRFLEEEQRAGVQGGKTG